MKLECPSCAYTGGPTLPDGSPPASRPGFRLAELNWIYYDIVPADAERVIQADPATRDDDVEQVPKETLIECGGCGETFPLPDPEETTVRWALECSDEG